MSEVFVLTAHARTVLEERSIPLEWVERVFENPARVEVDSEDPDLRHALGRIEERGGRVLGWFIMIWRSRNAS